MKICVVYDSVTGNTKMLADVIQKKYQAVLTDRMEDADVVFLGSWTDKGSLSERMKETAGKLHGKKVFLFGTCGFGGSPEYYEKLYDRAAALLDGSNELIGHYYCQGKMPLSVKERYVSMLQEHPEDRRMQASLQNFEDALTHPDQEDLDRLSEILDRLELG